MSKFEDYQCEHLFLLIGKNPLPNYVAAKLLAKSEAVGGKPTIYLVCSPDTLEFADKLADKLRDANFICEKPLVESSVPEDIRDEIEKWFPSTGKIGLNYTGGTKAMAVHAYRAIERLGKEHNVKFSYIDSGNLELCFDPRMGVNEEIKFKVGDPYDPNSKILFEQSRISLKDLLYLHKSKPRKRKSPNPRSRPRLPNLVAAMFQETLGNRRWKNSAGEMLKGLLSAQTKEPFTNEDQYESYLRQQQVSLPDNVPGIQAALQAVHLINKGAIDLGMLPTNQSAEEFCNFLKGTWLEDYVLGKVLSIKDECHLHNCGSSLEVALPFDERRPFFEIDVVAMRGYQLFAISCTLESRVMECKKKLFEIALRARQLGGDETRIALVCLANAYEKQQLEDQLKDDRIVVFGKDDLASLEFGLRKWFKGELFR